MLVLAISTYIYWTQRKSVFRVLSITDPKNWFVSPLIYQGSLPIPLTHCLKILNSSVAILTMLQGILNQVFLLLLPAFLGVMRLLGTIEVTAAGT